MQGQIDEKSDKNLKIINIFCIPLSAVNRPRVQVKGGFGFKGLGTGSTSVIPYSQMHYLVLVQRAFTSKQFSTFFAFKFLCRSVSVLMQFPVVGKDECQWTELALQVLLLTRVN